MTARHSRIARNEPDEKGEQLPGTVASQAAVPLSSSDRLGTGPDGQRDIFVFILSILHILSRSARSSCPSTGTPRIPRLRLGMTAIPSPLQR